MKFKHSKVRPNKPQGNSTIHQKLTTLLTALTPSEASDPQVGAGAWMPMPRKLRKDSCKNWADQVGQQVPDEDPSGRHTEGTAGFHEGPGLEREDLAPDYASHGEPTDAADGQEQDHNVGEMFLAGAENGI